VTDVAHVQRGVGGEVHFGDTTTPHGRRPTWIDFTTSSAPTSIIETSLERPLVVSRYFWSGVNAICQTRCPTNRVRPDLPGFRIDHRDTVRRSKCDQSGAVVLGELDTDRLAGFRARASHIE
jgi:hypothetical protein